MPKTMGRCGSTWFCDMLNAHSRILCAGEVFNPALRSEYVEAVNAWETSRDSAAVFRVLAKRSADAELVGFKVFREQVGDDVLQQLFRGIEHLILIERENLTAALVSELRAKQTTLWHARNEFDTASARAAPSLWVDVQSGRNRLAHARRTGVAVESIARAMRKDIIEVTYEAMLRDAGSVMANVFQRLGLGLERVSSQFRKLHDGYEFVGNLREVNEVLGPEFGTL